MREHSDGCAIQISTNLCVIFPVLKSMKLIQTRKIWDVAMFPRQTVWGDPVTSQFFPGNGDGFVPKSVKSAHRAALRD